MSKEIIWHRDHTLCLNVKNRGITGDRIEVYGHDYGKFPPDRYTLNIDVENVQNEFYFFNMHHVHGVFKNTTFNEHTLIDRSVFENVTFENCHFDGVSIRCCKFINYKFINCTGFIKYARMITINKNCYFENSNMDIHQIDDYAYVHGKRFGKQSYSDRLSVTTLYH